MATRKTKENAGARRAGVHIALLRGINVGGHKKVPMADLRALCAALGWRDVATYIQSGNVVFAARGAPAALAAALQRAIEQRFAFAVPVIVRTAAEWLLLCDGAPFGDAAAARPNLLHAALAMSPAQASAAAALQPYCGAGERVAVHRGNLWIDYCSGVARSKLTPAVLDRAVGAPVTARNWRTVQQLATMARAATDVQ